MPFSGTYLHQMNFLVLGELNHPSLDVKTVLQETRGNSEICVHPKKWGQNNGLPETHAGLNKHDGFVALLVDRDINGHTKPQGGLVTQEPGDFAQSSTLQHWV